ncbi:unnamed protein product, partial [Meganyctiphanes norvegica]
MFGFVFRQSTENIGFIARTVTTSSVYHQGDKHLYMQNDGRGNKFNKRYNQLFKIADKYKTINLEDIARNGCNFYNCENSVVQKRKKYLNSNFMPCVSPNVLSRERMINSMSKLCINTRLINGVYSPFNKIHITETYLTNFQLPLKRHYSQNVKGFDIHKRISSLKVKKRVQRKKKMIEDETEEGLKSVEGFESPARHKFLTFDPDFDLPDIPLHKPPPR